MYKRTNIHCLDVITALLSKLMEEVIGEIKDEFSDEYDQLLEQVSATFQSRFTRWRRKSKGIMTSAVFSDEVEPVIYLRTIFHRWKALTDKRRLGIPKSITIILLTLM